MPWYRVKEFFHKFPDVVENIKQNDHFVLKKSFFYTQHKKNTSMKWLKCKLRFAVTFNIESKCNNEISVITSIRFAKLSNKFLMRITTTLKDQPMMIMPRATLNRVSGKLRRAFQLRPPQSSEQTLTKETPPTAIFVSICLTKTKEI